MIKMEHINETITEYKRLCTYYAEELEKERNKESSHMVAYFQGKLDGISHALVLLDTMHSSYLINEEKKVNDMETQWLKHNEKRERQLTGDRYLGDL
jgi:Na+/phosphate symporter